MGMLAAKMQRESHPHHSDQSDNESTHSTRSTASARSSVSDGKPVDRLNTDSSTYQPSQISMDTIKVTVPEDAVLTPQKSSSNPNSLRMQVKEPQSADIVDLDTPQPSLKITNESKAVNIEVPDDSKSGSVSSSSGSENDFVSPGDGFPPRDAGSDSRLSRK